MAFLWEYYQRSKQNQQSQIKEHNFYANISLEHKSVNVILFCQVKLKVPADYLIIFTDQDKFLKQSKLVRKHYSMTHKFYVDQFGQMIERNNFDSALHFGCLAKKIIFINLDKPIGYLNSQELIQEIKFKTQKNIIQALESIIDESTKQQTQRVVIASNSIFPEIFSIQQQAELFVKALNNLKNQKNKLEISIVSQNKYELATYLHELISHPEQQEEQKQSVLYQKEQQIREKNNVGNCCPKGHTLVLQLNSIYQAYCVFCKQIAQITKKCDICKTYVCQYCVENIIKGFQCSKKHKLIYCHSEIMRKNYLCDECQLGSFHIHCGVWYDKDCILDICGYCMREKIEIGLVEKKIIQLQVLKNVYKKIGTSEQKLFRTLESFQITKH